MNRVYALFLLSGAAGLAYQVVWARLFHDVFGVTVHAIATVLAVFLSGLALGGWLIGRLADRRSRALVFYGWLEIGIAATGAFSLLMIHALGPVHLWAANRFESSPALVVLVRVLIACVVMLPSTILMGGTLPAMTRVVVRGLGRFGRELSFLYALNTAGAVLGTLATGFVLIRWIGLHATIYVAVTINFVVGVLSLYWGARFPSRQPQEGRPAEPTPKPSSSGRSGSDAGLLGAIAVSGFVSLGLEILWTRILMLALGTTAYAFVTMLASFLIGITLGSFIIRTFADRIGNPRQVFGWIQLAIAATVLGTLPLAGLAIGSHWLQGWGSRWLALIVLRFGVSMALMLVPATLIGMTFPLAGKIWTRDPERLGGQVGQVYSANTAGNILGATVCGFLLLPAVGLQAGVALLAALSLLNAAWGFLPTSRVGRRERWAEALLVAVAVACAVLAILWQPQPFRAVAEHETDRVVYYKEGVVATVKVLDKGGHPDNRWISVDGILIGQSVGGVDAKQQALAHFPFLLMPEPPRSVLSIGLGSGVLIGEVAKHDSIERIDCLEISPAVIEGARHFDRFTGSVLDHPSVRVINDDGVNFLRRSDERYDAIISDAKSRSAHAANSLFFSRDYYELSRDHLTADGLMIQWVPLNLPPSELKTILRTFMSSFPYVYVWVAAPHSGYLIGREKPLELDLVHIDRILQQPSLEGLRRYGWTDAYGFAGLLTADRDSLADWLGQGTTINTLEKPVLEFYSPRSYAVPPYRCAADNLLALRAGSQNAKSNIVFTATDSERFQTNHAAAGAFIEAMALLNIPDPGIVDRALQLISWALATAPSSGPLRYASLAPYRRLVFARPASAEVRVELANALRFHGQVDEARAQYLEALRLDPGNVAARDGINALNRRRG